jgi:hypothetical protein
MPSRSAVRGCGCACGVLVIVFEITRHAPVNVLAPRRDSCAGGTTKRLTRIALPSARLRRWRHTMILGPSTSNWRGQRFGYQLMERPTACEWMAKWRYQSKARSHTVPLLYVTTVHTLPACAHACGGFPSTASRAALTESNRGSSYSTGGSRIRSHSTTTAISSSRTLCSSPSNI